MEGAPRTMVGADWLAYLRRNKQKQHISEDFLMGTIVEETQWDKRIGAATLLGKDVYGKQFIVGRIHGSMMFRAGHALLSFSRLEFGMVVLVVREFAALPKMLLDINGATIRKLLKSPMQKLMGGVEQRLLHASCSMRHALKAGLRFAAGNMNHISELVEAAAAGDSGIDLKNGKMALLMVAGREQTGAEMLHEFQNTRTSQRANIMMIDFGDDDKRAPMRIASMVM